MALSLVISLAFSISRLPDWNTLILDKSNINILEVAIFTKYVLLLHIAHLVILLLQFMSYFCRGLDYDTVLSIIRRKREQIQMLFYLFRIKVIMNHGLT